MSAPAKSKPRSDGLRGAASTRTTTSLAAGTGVGTLVSDSSRSPVLLTSDRSCSPVRASLCCMSYPSKSAAVRKRHATPGVGRAASGLASGAGFPTTPADDALEFHRRTLRLRTTKDPKMSIASYGTATCAAAILGAAVTAAAFAAAPAEQPILREIAHSPDPVQLQATVQALVGFGTRHTLSDTAPPRRGIGAARRWAQPRVAEIVRGCRRGRPPPAPPH